MSYYTFRTGVVNGDEEYVIDTVNRGLWETTTMWHRFKSTNKYKKLRRKRKLRGHSEQLHTLWGDYANQQLEANQ